MEKTVNQVGPAEYELEIRASAVELAPEIDKAIRTQRGRTNLKGFRPGMVPVQMVRKMYGKALAYGVAEQKVQKTYEEFMDTSEYDILGRPTITTLDYDLDQDLRAVIRFGVRPEIELKDLSTEKITKLVHEVTDEEVNEEIERRLRREADLVPIEEAIGKEDHVTVDIQRLDDATGTPVIGEREEGVTFFLDDQNLKDELRDAILGKQPGDSIRVDIKHEGEHHHEDEPHSDLLELPGSKHEHTHTHPYQVTIKEAKRRELPELDEEFIKKITDDAATDEAGLREEVRKQLERSWQQYSGDFVNENIVERMLELHPVDVPESVVDVYLDSFVEDVKRRNKGKLPAGFDEQAFRNANREEAEKQSRWMLIRDKLVKDESLEVTDEDVNAYFGKMGEGEEMSPDTLRQLYTSMPGLVEQLKQRILSERVFSTLEQRFEVVEKNREEIEREIEERNAAAPSRIIT
jgi:trigger factor